MRLDRCSQLVCTMHATSATADLLHAAEGSSGHVKCHILCVWLKVEFHIVIWMMKMGRHTCCLNHGAWIMVERNVDKGENQRRSKLQRVANKSVVPCDTLQWVSVTRAGASNYSTYHDGILSTIALWEYNLFRLYYYLYKTLTIFNYVVSVERMFIRATFTRSQLDRDQNIFQYSL